MKRKLTTKLRLSAVPLFSWIAGGAVSILLGVALISDDEVILFRVAGVACVTLGVVAAVASLRITAGFTDEGVFVRNRFRSFLVPYDQLAEVRSRIIQTPMTRANGFGQLELRDTRGRTVHVAATTGLAPKRAQQFVEECRRRAPAAKLDVNESWFPMLARNTRGSGA